MRPSGTGTVSGHPSHEVALTMTRQSRTPELARLDEIAGRYDPSNPEEEFDYYLKRLHREVAAPWFMGHRMLEVGCATGELTSLLAPLAAEYHVVEGSRTNIEVASRRVPSATFIHSLWEEFHADGAYSDVIMFNALEHVREPVPLLERVRGWVAQEGRLHVVVPNSESLHRLVGVEMGILETTTSLSESDLRIGHFRVYSIDTLLGDLRTAGFVPVHWQGLFLKILSNRQMLGWDWELIHALHAVGQRFPVHCAELYAVAQVG
jgi:trans-aconitate methyltransferase